MAKGTFSHVEEKNLNKEQELLDSLGGVHKEWALRIQDSTFLTKLRSGAEYIHTITIRGQTIYMRLLTIEERRHAEIKAREKWAKESELVRLSLQPLVLYYEMIEILTLALNVESYDKKIIQRVVENDLKSLVEAEVYNLFKEYQNLESKYNPVMDEVLDPDILETLLSDLEKKKVRLNNISRLELEGVCRHLLLERGQLMDSLRTLTSPNDSTSE